MDVWVDERIVVGTSGIAGRGWFASEAIPAGEVVVRFGGRLVGDDELAELLRTTCTYVDTLCVAPGVHLVLPADTAAHYGNHSCDPTLHHVGPYELATRRAVRAGEELTVDYATHSAAGGLDMRCTCGAPNCRGRVVGTVGR